MSDLIWRAARLSDAGTVVELFRTIAQDAPVGLEAKRDEVEVRFTRPRLNLDTDTVVAVDSAGAVVAYGEAADMGVGQDRLRIRLTNAVHPGLGEAATRHVHEWLLRRGTELHRQRRADLPGVLGTRCAAADRDRLALLTNSGFDVVDWTLDLVRPVDPPVPATPEPSGVVIQRYERRHDETARVAHNDAFAEVPSALLPDPQSWPHHAVGLPAYLPDASYLAFAGDPPGEEIAGFLFSLDHRNPTGQGEAVLHCLGTRKPWRRQGLASALIGRALAWYRDAGYPRARLQVQRSNTAATRLYERLGFTDSGRGYATLQRALT